MRPQKIAVIGGVAAGTAAAAEAKRVDPAADVVLFESGPYISYGACEMPMVISGEVEDVSSLIAFSPERFAKEKNVSVRTDTHVLSLDARAGRLTYRTRGVEEATTERFDKFILATGATAVRPEFEGSSDRNVFVLRELTDARSIQDYLHNNEVGHVVVVGAGFVGLEVGDALRRRGMRVTLLQSGDGPLHRNVDASISDLIRERLQAEGVVYRSERLTGFKRSGGRVTAVRTDAGELIGCQMVVLAVGTVPNTSLGTEAGVKTGDTGGFRATDAMRTNLTNVWVCGDCAEVRRVIDESAVLSPLSLTAFRTARVAGANAARKGQAKQAQFPGVVGAQALKIFDTEIAFAGLTSSEATAAGFRIDRVLIKHRNVAGLVAGSTFMHVLLIFDLTRGRLLGGQLIGGPGTALRADVLIPVIRQGGSVSDLYDLDLIYAPPFSPRLDPLLVAAKKAVGLVALHRR